MRSGGARLRGGILLTFVVAAAVAVGCGDSDPPAGAAPSADTAGYGDKGPKRDLEGIAKVLDGAREAFAVGDAGAVCDSLSREALAQWRSYDYCVANVSQLATWVSQGHVTLASPRIVRFRVYGHTGGVTMRVAGQPEFRVPFAFENGTWRMTLFFDARPEALNASGPRRG